MARAALDVRYCTRNQGCARIALTVETLMQVGASSPGDPKLFDSIKRSSGRTPSLICRVGGGGRFWCVGLRPWCMFWRCRCRILRRQKRIKKKDEEEADGGKK